ncbi:MAG TPA: tetraprenyl-beta-curcumene synthase family protein [Firmicutes bacterium]|nr:tetraprenyl-beta-curcumene synthase family protein [Bacillota bacterium]
MGIRANDIAMETSIIADMLFRILPMVDRELGEWASRLDACPDPVLKELGRSSILYKRFHAQGGSVYAAYPWFLVRDSIASESRLRAGKRYNLARHKGSDLDYATASDQVYHLIKFIVAFQTISDYLDNLCDRAGCLDGRAFWTLHQSMLDALEPPPKPGAEHPSSGAPDTDYYCDYPHKSDGGYLGALVTQCRQQLVHFPSYPLIKKEVLKLASLYRDLQVKKHVEVASREGLLVDWYNEHASGFPSIQWWEFAAACGSTLGIFALLASAISPLLSYDDVCAITRAYFPWIAGLHILLDYLIDQEEDRRGGDLNFVSFYKSRDTCRERLMLFFRESMNRASELPSRHFHMTVVRGLLALYFSDPKVKLQGLDDIADKLLHDAGLRVRLVRAACSALRAARVV